MEARTEESQTATAVQQMSNELHDLCQPLTALQCRLEMANLMNTPEDYREAVTLGLSECARLAGHVQRMREVLRGLLEASDPED